MELITGRSDRKADHPGREERHMDLSVVHQARQDARLAGATKDRIEYDLRARQRTRRQRHDFAPEFHSAPVGRAISLVIRPGSSNSKCRASTPGTYRKPGRARHSRSVATGV